MFTILIREPNGDERLREDALEVRRRPRGNPKTGDGSAPEVVIRWSDGVETCFSGLGKDGRGTEIFVMNRSGSTVATYRL